MLYTFSFGILMYLTLRSFRFLVVAMLIHGLTDPTTILATGDLDKITDSGSTDGVLAVAGLVTLLLIPAGYLLVIFIRGHAIAER